MSCSVHLFLFCFFFFFKQKTAYEMRISDWSSDVCSSDLVIDRLHPDAADHAGHRRTSRVERWRLRKEILEIRASRQRGVERRLAVAGQPAHDLVDLRLRATLLLRLGNIVGIDARDGDRIDAMPRHAPSPYRPPAAGRDRKSTRP